MRPPPLHATAPQAGDELQDAAWRVLLAAAAAAREPTGRESASGKRPTLATDPALGIDATGARLPPGRERASAWLVRDGGGGWGAGPAAPAAVRSPSATDATWSTHAVASGSLFEHEELVESGDRECLQGDLLLRASCVPSKLPPWTTRIFYTLTCSLTGGR